MTGPPKENPATRPGFPGTSHSQPSQAAPENVAQRGLPCNAKIVIMRGRQYFEFENQAALRAWLAATLRGDL